MPISVTKALKPKYTPSAKKFIELLESLPPDKLYETQEILDLCRCGSHTLTRFNLEHDTSRYRVISKYDARRLFYGNPKAIAAYREGECHKQ